MDSMEVRKALPKREIIQIDNLRIALTHGWGNPQRLIPLLKEDFKKEKVNAIVFGHSHYSINEVKDGILFFNPGSPTDKIFSPYNSYGILEIVNNNIKGWIVRI
jgi:putative phosphoesterase